MEYYGHYYLGSVVLTSTDADNAIIDGQQRLTSLTLLLIYLNNLQKGRPDRVDIDSLIYSEKFGRKSFNIRVEEREPCLNALFKGELFDPTGQPESVQNIYARYKDIEEIFPEELKRRALPFFIDWLIYKVYLVEITAHTEQDAHKIFVSMNDRGLSLTPTEMLKGYLLSEIKDDRQRNRANNLWKQKILEIKNLNQDSKEEDADFIKNWLRAQYAETIREKKKGAHPEDFDLIGTEFHKWVRENASKIGLRRSQEYEDFVLKEFKLFADAYIKLKQCSSQLQPGYEYVYYNANRNFTLQYQLILAALDPQDDPDTIDRKIKAMACFIDQYIAIRVFNFKVVDYSTIKNAVFNLTKKFRRLPLTELVDKLQEEIRQMGFNLDGIDKFYLNQFTGRYMLHILARMTHYIEQESGLSTQFENYVSRTIKNPYDIEHIWADQYRRHATEFATEDEFNYYRNRFGGLLLLPRDKNRSYQDKSYQEKLPMYFGENLLVRTLHADCYKHNPQFLSFKQRSGLNFKSYDQFNRQQLDERQQLYKEICQQIWHVDKIRKCAGL